MHFTDFKPVDMSRMSAAQLSAVARIIDPSAPEAWVDLAELAFAVLRANPDTAPLTDDQLARCAAMVAYQVAGNWGGQSVYFPIGVRATVATKKRAIEAAFTGHNHAALAREHGVTETRVRQILAEESAPKRVTQK